MTKLNRLRLQYSLRSLLVFVLVASAFMAWFGARYRAACQQRDAVAAVRGLGLRVLYDYECDGNSFRASPSLGFKAAPAGPAGPAWARNLLGIDFFADAVEVSYLDAFDYMPHQEWPPPLPLSDTTIGAIAKLTRIECLDLGNTRIARGGLGRLAGLRRLSYLGLACTGVTDVGLEGLGKLKGLQVLNLRRCRISDASLESVGKLANLRVLVLSECRIIDAGVAKLGGLTQLEELDLSETGVTDDGLQHLRRLSKLRVLNLWRTDVSDASRAELRTALPECGPIP